METDRQARFGALYADAYLDVLRFVRRRAPATEAEDVTAEAFLVVWRRLGDAPTSGEDLRAWLFGIARGCLLNARRGSSRREALAVRLAASAGTDIPGPVSLETAPGEFEEYVAARVDLARAWALLRPADQEVLALTVFDELSGAHAARVLGTTATAYRLRLLRARRALGRALSRTVKQPHLLRPQVERTQPLEEIQP